MSMKPIIEDYGDGYLYYCPYDNGVMVEHIDKRTKTFYWRCHECGFEWRGEDGDLDSKPV